MQKPILLVDMDDTLCDYSGQFISDLKEKIKIKNSDNYEAKIKEIESIGKNIKIICQNPEYEAERHIITCRNGWWENLPVITPNMNLVTKLYNLGFEVNILTKGPTTKPYAWTEKFLWIKNNCQFEYKMNIVTDKSLFYGKILFDDHVPYVKSWLKHRPRGLAILPYDNINKDFKNKQAIHFNGENYEEIQKAVMKYI